MGDDNSGLAQQHGGHAFAKNTQAHNVLISKRTFFCFLLHVEINYVYDKFK